MRLLSVLSLTATIVCACGKPTTPIAGSCIVELDASMCVNIHNSDKDATLDAASAKYVCRNVLTGLYFEKPCSSGEGQGREVVGSCSLPAKDGVQFEYVLYAPRWTVEDGQAACEQSKGIWQ